MKSLLSQIITKFRAMDSLTKSIFIVLLVLAITTSVLAFIFIRNLTTTMSILDLPGAPVLEDINAGEEQQTEFASIQPAAEPWDGVSRVTILILGLDYRDWKADDTPHSDTMILVTLDPLSDTMGMFSIPRDMWVNVPSFGFYTINTAYFLGESYNLPGGGPALAVETVEKFLGVPVHFYAQIDFGAFIQFIDEIGGILITPDQNVEVEEFGKDYEHVLVAGQQYTLPGVLALSYARNRYAGGSDIERAKRQQQVIMAIRDRILQYDQLPTLISKAPALYQQLSEGIRTNMNLQQAIQLAPLVFQIPTENIKKGVIGPNMFYEKILSGPNAKQILIPISNQIRLLRDDIFATGAAGPIAVPGENSTLVIEEAAKVLVQNGTQVSGLASRTTEYLRSQGIDATEGNIDQTGATQIIIYNAKPYTVAHLASLMNVASTNIQNRFDPNVGIDIAIILGSDWANNNPLP
jgi:LCP family protein required for cell wall assembly